MRQTQRHRVDTNSKAAFAQAQRLIPGGVNSPVRACKSVGVTPLFIERGEGSRIYDVEGQSYIDYVMSWGPLIAGHAHPEVLDAIVRTAKNGTSFGAPTELETRMAELVCERVDSVEMVRMVNSGTEATMSAIRLARGYTRRDLIMKFEGNYHGHVDSLLIKAGSGVATLGLPDSPGVPLDVAGHTLTVSYNDLSAVEQAFERYGERLAAVIVEPVAGNMGVVVPREGFLQGLRELTSRHGSLLIFDEVMTGFRVAYGCAQGLYGVKPDLTCFGKVIGGGLPVGAYGGTRELMEQIAPSGPIYQAGTLSGNPLAMAAGYTTLQLLEREGAYDRLEALTSRLASGLKQAADDVGVKLTINRVGSMICPFFSAQQVTDYESAKKADLSKFSEYYSAMLDHGVSIPPSQFESWFVSLAHNERDIDETIFAHQSALQRIKEKF